MSASHSRVLELFERAAQSLEAPSGASSSSSAGPLPPSTSTKGSRRLEFSTPALPSGPPVPSPWAGGAPAATTASRRSARSNPRRLVAQPDQRLDAHRAAVLGQALLKGELEAAEERHDSVRSVDAADTLLERRTCEHLLAAELSACERQAALVPELLQLGEALKLQRAELTRLACAAPELKVVTHVLQLELQRAELRHHPLPDELAERYEAQQGAHAQALPDPAG